ncbi:MAG: SHOCT domain-containing protein, partial [Pseudomonadota bacterium]|nr:SHOCT domain-containing protein [Pseudomonadota bacterium]
DETEGMMRMTAVAMTLSLSGCASGTVTLPWAQGPSRSNSECTAACDAHYAECPQIFAHFPERGAVECPANHSDCLKICAARQESRIAAPVPPSPPAPAAVAPVKPPGPVRVDTKEGKLRELKHLHDEGLISEDIYKERQRAILSDP